MATLTQLEYVVAVDQCRHFGRAASLCHVSQPTLSAQMHKLEEEIGVTLFDRSKQPVLPTDDGKPLIEQAKVVLNEFSRLTTMTQKNPDELVGEFRLGVIPTIAPYLMPLFLKPFAERYRQIELYIEELSTEKIIEALDRDQIDAGVAATPLGLTRIDEQPLYYEPFRVYVGRGHPLAGTDKVSERMLDSGQVWLLAEEHCLREQIIVACGSGTERGSFRSVHLNGGSLDTIIELVASGQGYTLLPLLVADSVSGRRFPGSVIPFVRPEPVREVSLIYRRGYLKQQLMQHVRTTIEEHLPVSLPRQKAKTFRVLGLSGQFK